MAEQPDFDRWVFQLLAGLAGMATLLGVGLVVVAPHEKGVWKVIPFLVNAFLAMLAALFYIWST